MMKFARSILRFAKTMFIIYGVVIVCVYIFFTFVTPWRFMRTTIPLEIFGTIFVCTLLYKFTERFEFKHAILERLLEFAIMLAAVLIMWRVVGWHNDIPIVVMLVTVPIVYVVVWLLIVRNTDRDIDFINKQIKRYNPNSDE